MSELYQQEIGCAATYVRAALLVVLTAIFYVLPAKSMALEVACDSDYVSAVGAEINVAPTGEDDTENIECALNEAVKLGVQKVKLESGEYVVSSAVDVGGFRGQFEGVTRDSTIIVLADQSFDCSGAGGRALGFGIGEPTVRYMRFELANPCSSAGTGFAVLAFGTNPDDCSKRTLFGSVDRVDFVRENISPAVAAAVFVDRAPACPTDLPALGTFKLNRSDIRGFTYGLFSSMASGAQVDVNFNSFSGNEMSVYISNANQNTTVTGNDISYGDVINPLLVNNAGVEVVSDGSGRDGNRTVVHNNRFIDAGLSSEDTDGVLVVALQKRVKQSVLVTNNLFVMNGGSANKGVGIYDVDAGTIQANRFMGMANDAIGIGPLLHNQSVDDWAISGNTFSAFQGMNADVFLLEGTKDSYVGPQNALVIAPNGNFVAPQD